LTVLLNPVASASRSSRTDCLAVLSRPASVRRGHELERPYLAWVSSPLECRAARSRCRSCPNQGRAAPARSSFCLRPTLLVVPAATPVHLGCGGGVLPAPRAAV